MAEPSVQSSYFCRGIRTQKHETLRQYPPFGFPAEAERLYVCPRCHFISTEVIEFINNKGAVHRIRPFIADGQE